MSENTETTETTEKVDETGAGAETATETPQQLPDDHPLVKTLAAQKEQIKTLKERAQRLDELEQANLTEQEKAEARVKAAEERAAELELRNNIAEVAIEFGLSKEDAHLLKDVSSVEAMRSLAGRLAESSKEKRNHYVPTEGTGTPPPKDERREFANFLAGRGA